MPETVCSCVVVVHPSPLFSEALAGIISTATLKLEHISTDIDDIPLEKISGSPLLIVGGKTPSHLVDNVRSLKACLCSARIVAIGTSEAHVVRMALEAGAAGYLNEEMTSGTLIMALELVLRGETVLPSGAVSALSECLAANGEIWAANAETDDRALPIISPQAIRANDAGLSARQATILKALMEGTPNKVIAQQLRLSEATVKLHVKAVLKKIQVRNRTQAAVWALKQASNTNT